MMRYSIKPRNRIFVKGYEFLSFAKNMGKNIGKNIRKDLSGKYNQKLLDDAKQSATDALKTTSKREIQKIVEATGDLIGNKIVNRITKVLKIHRVIFQKQLQMNMIKKHLKKETYFQKKGRKLLMI